MVGLVHRLRKMISSSAFVLLVSAAVTCVGTDSLQAFWPHGHHRPFHHRPFHHGHWNSPLGFSNHCYPSSYWGFNSFGRNVASWNFSYRTVGYCYNPYFGYRSIAYYPYYANSSYCWPYGYYNYFPAWHTTGYYFTVNQANLNPVGFQPAWQIPAGGVGVLQANRLQAANLPRLAANAVGQGRGLVQAAAGVRNANVPALASSSGLSSIPNVYSPIERLPFSPPLPAVDSLDSRLAQTRAILQRINQRQLEPLGVARDQILADAGRQIPSRYPPRPANSARLANRFETLERPNPASANPASANPAYLQRGDEAFASGNFHTAEIWYKQAGREGSAQGNSVPKLTKSQRQQAAIRLATAQFAVGNFSQSARTFRWILEQNPASLPARSAAALAPESKLDFWAQTLPSQNLAALYGQNKELDTQLDRLAQVALENPNQNTEELWLLGVLIGLKGSSEKSELFLRQAANGEGLYASAALQILEKSIEPQSQLRLAAQPSRSP